MKLSIQGLKCWMTWLKPGKKVEDYLVIVGEKWRLTISRLWASSWTLHLANMNNNKHMRLMTSAHLTGNIKPNCFPLLPKIPHKWKWGKLRQRRTMVFWFKDECWFYCDKKQSNSSQGNVIYRSMAHKSLEETSSSCLVPFKVVVKLLNELCLLQGNGWFSTQSWRGWSFTRWQLIGVFSTSCWHSSAAVQTVPPKMKNNQITLAFC